MQVNLGFASRCSVFFFVVGFMLCLWLSRIGVDVFPVVLDDLGIIGSYFNRNILNGKKML